MKKIIVNGFAWWLDTSTGKFYENEDKSGVSFDSDNPHLTKEERQQISDQMKYS